MKQLLIVLVCLFLVAPAIAKWTDTETVTASGVTGSIDITLQTLNIEISSDYLYPGMTEQKEIQITNTGKTTCDLTYTVRNCPSYLICQVEFVPISRLRKNGTTSVRLTFSILESETIHQNETVNMSVDIMASN